MRENSFYSLTVSAPGSLMLMGEHAVVYGQSCLVAAHQHRIFVTVSSRLDSSVLITSDPMGSFDLTDPSQDVPREWAFVSACLNEYRPFLPCGITIDITGFQTTLGFGSSAAVVAGVLGALECFCFKKKTVSTALKNKLLIKGRGIIRHVQGVGSGADLAASLFGGILHYNPRKKSPPRVILNQDNLPLMAIYSGYKTPTATVIQHVKALKNKHPKIFKMLFKASQECVKNAVYALLHKDLMALGEIMTIHQGLMLAYDVSTPEIDAILNDLKKKDTILGAKISGSGKGDCVIALGHLMDDRACNIYPIQIAKDGLKIEAKD